MVDQSRGKHGAPALEDNQLAAHSPAQVLDRRFGHAGRGGARKRAWHRAFKLPSALAAKNGRKHGKIFLFFGVILPLIAVAFELTTHFCAQHFFDPFPSSSHVVLFLLIPLSNCMVWLSGRRDLSAHFGFMSLISGMSMGIGCLYALMFLPLTPHSALYTLVFGFGLLGFAPLLSVPCTWLSGKTVCQLAESRKTFFDAHQVEHIGHLIVLCLVVAVELPSTLTRMNLSLAADPATERQGVQWLRQFGSEEVMLRACYERSGRATDILGSLYEAGHPLSIESARNIFYRVTGKPFNSVPIPSAARATIQHAGLIDDPNGLNANVKDEFDLDSDIAGENVSGVARGLSISNAQITGAVDPDAGVAQLDWSATFANSSPYDREARAKLLLPPGGVISKATVTIGGVEHDASILVRSLARTIYKQSVAEHRKDPLLVSTCGIDQVLIQCYPVQPNVDTTVHLKISAPLILSPDKQSGALMLPAFEERNFQFDRPVGVAVDSGAGKKQIVEVPSAQVARFKAIPFARNSVVQRVISKADNGSLEANAIIPTYKMPDKLTIVIDGSASMSRHMPELAKGLRALPSRVKTDVVIVGDDVQLLGNNSDPGSFATVIGALEKYPAVGGHSDDNQVLNRIATTPVLWVHGAQPMNTNNSQLLADLLKRPSETPWLYDFQMVSGANELLSGLEPNENFVAVARTGDAAEDLERLFHSWTSTGNSASNQRFVSGVMTDAATDASTEVREQPIPGLKDLYGYQKLLQSYNSADKTLALTLAEQYHLVSPVSSAVALEDVPSSHPSPIASYAHRKSGLSSIIDQFGLQPLAMKGSQADLQTSHDHASFEPALKNYSITAEEKKSEAVHDQLQTVDDTVSGGARLGDAERAVVTEGANGAKSAKDLDVKTKASEDIPFSVESPPPASNPSAAALEAPSLQGATNGTIGPETGSIDKERSSTSIIGKSLRMEGRYNTGSNGDAQKADAPMQSESGTSSWLPRWDVNRQVMESRAPLYQAQTSAPSNGLVGAPVDPRYGQSNEVAVDSNKNGFLDTESPFMRSLAIFILVFLSGHAFFKLLRAVLRSRSN